MWVPGRSLVASAPTRLDFGGGWTDVPPFPAERGGFVCNVAIERRATVTVTIGTDAELVPSPDASFASPLVHAAMRRAVREGELPSNLNVSIASDFPVAAGLGGSSAAGVALAAALALLQGRERTAGELAEWSRAVEVDELGVAGGRQDHYAAAFGGALGIAFGEDTVATHIALSDDTIRALESRCLLVYTGESRISSTTIAGVLDAYRQRTRHVVDALDRMKSLAMQMRDALHDGAIETFEALVDEHWQHQQSLHPGISTERIDLLEADARSAGATAVKALGASGGGCVIVFTGEDERADVERAVAPWGELLDWHIATDGVRAYWNDFDRSAS